MERHKTHLFSAIVQMQIKLFAEIGNEVSQAHLREMSKVLYCKESQKTI